MMDQRLEISETGRGKDRVFVCLLEGSRAQRRRWAVEFMVADKMDGHAKAVAFLDGKRVKPTDDELAKALEPYQRLANGQSAVEAKPKKRLSLRARIRSRR